MTFGEFVAMREGLLFIQPPAGGLSVRPAPQRRHTGFTIPGSDLGADPL
jgi:hypothetical protein